MAAGLDSVEMEGAREWVATRAFGCGGVAGSVWVFCVRGRDGIEVVGVRMDVIDGVGGAV